MYIAMLKEEKIKFSKDIMKNLEKYDNANELKKDRLNRHKEIDRINVEILELNTTRAILLKEISVLNIEKQIRELEAQRRQLEHC